MQEQCSTQADILIHAIDYKATMLKNQALHAGSVCAPAGELQVGLMCFSCSFSSCLQVQANLFQPM